MGLKFMLVMKNKRITLLTIGLFGIVCGLLMAHTPNSFALVKADGPETISAGYCSSDMDATKENLKFEMLYNSAPLANYQPQDNDCVTIRRNGRVIKLANDHNADMITKIGSNSYVLNTNTLGEYAPQAGDVYTIKGQFLSHDLENKYTGKYMLDISETSFVVSENDYRSYFMALPQQCVDGGQASMPPEPDQQWHFLFNLMGLEQSDAPVTGDSYAYYPTSVDDVFIDGEPAAKIDRQILRRRDNYGYLFYVCSHSEYQDWGSRINLNSLIVFDGTFIYDGDITLQNNKKIGFSLNEVAFHKIGPKVNDYEVVNFRKYLFDSINNGYDANNYSGEAKAEVARILADLDNDISEPETVKEVYKVYNEINARLANFDVDPSAATEYLNQLKQNAINEIKNYPVYENYFPEQQEIINGYISAFVNEVEPLTNKRDIVDLLNQTKNKINNVKVKKTVMREAVLNQTPGFEEYLCAYDGVSLNDLNLNTLTYHGDYTERKNNDFNTNSQDFNQYNSFIPSRENKKGNVVFQFLYQTNAIPVTGGNVMVALRGMAYSGYKFAIDTNTRGCYVTSIGQDSSSWIGGTSFIFVNDETFIVEVGAIDLIEFNLTWLFVRVDGEIRYAAVVDSLGICVNPRVSIAANDNFEDGNDYPGTWTVANYGASTSSKGNKYVSSPQLNKEFVSNNKTIYCSSFENEIPYSNDVSYVFHPSSPDVITLTRGGATTSIGDIFIPIMAKVSPTDYQIDIKDWDFVDGDILTIKGQFTYFVEKTKTKQAFIFGKMVLVYNASANVWDQNCFLDDYKEDAKLQLDYFVDLDDYSQKVALAVSGVISKGKKQIDNCVSQEEVENILNATKAKLLRFKTVLESLRSLAISEVKEYKKDQIDNYRDEELREIKNLQEEAILNINNALTEEEIVDIVIAFKESVDSLKTNAEYDKEELEEARRNGIKKIQNHYASLNIDKYSDKKREQINNDTIKAISDVESAKSIQEIDQIVKQYMSAHKQNGNKVNLAVIIIPISSVAVLAGVGVLVFFLVRRRRKTV